MRNTPNIGYRARYIVRDKDILENAVILVNDSEIIGIESIQNCSAPIVDLGHVALVPGLVNAHSHAFQRAIRGHTEYIDSHHHTDNFWTWRQKMYQAAATFTPEQFYSVAKLAFLEMLLSGITTVGEFHYIHHQPDGAYYDDPNELSKTIIAAANDIDIRICLLRVAYARAGYNAALNPLQQRFITSNVDEYLSHTDDLKSWINATGRPHNVTIGLAPHSIRAVPQNWLSSLRKYSQAHNLALHMHACEQRREVQESIDEYGLTPIELLHSNDLLNSATTIVHGTHLTSNDLDLMTAARPTICACPTTERNLGDGFLPAAELVQRGIPISLGSDSHTVIDLWEEMRLVEYHERLQREERNVLAGISPGVKSKPLTTGQILWPMSTYNGAKSLHIKTGILSKGHRADFISLNLDHISLVGTTPKTLLNDITLSMASGAVCDVFVNGKHVVHNGKHPQQESVIQEYRAAQQFFTTD